LKNTKNFKRKRVRREDLERKLLGMVLFCGELRHAKKLQPSDFSDLRNKIIFGIMLDLEEEKQPVNKASIEERLTSKKIESPYLQQIQECQCSEDAFIQQVIVLKER